ncbi:lycopene cyclase domain-containing protein [Nesterenkonia populi]
MGGLTYLALCAPFIAFSVVLALGAARVQVRRRSQASAASEPQAGLLVPAAGIAALVLIVLTAVFDNVIIGVGLVSYDDEVISGLRIGQAPIEDFAYPIAGVILLPAVWVLLRPLETRRRASDS